MRCRWSRSRKARFAASPALEPQPRRLCRSAPAVAKAWALPLELDERALVLRRRSSSLALTASWRAHRWPQSSPHVIAPPGPAAARGRPRRRSVARQGAATRRRCRGSAPFPQLAIVPERANRRAQSHSLAERLRIVARPYRWSWLPPPRYSVRALAASIVVVGARSRRHFFLPLQWELVAPAVGAVQCAAAGRALVAAARFVIVARSTHSPLLVTSSSRRHRPARGLRAFVALRWSRSRTRPAGARCRRASRGVRWRTASCRPHRHYQPTAFEQAHVSPPSRWQHFAAGSRGISRPALASSPSARSRCPLPSAFKIV